ncbi:MAG: S-methyl-5-thioribose-1-phosphate isomerase, partial [Chloroflexi bacterium]
MRTVEWHDGKVRMIDQKRIPWQLEFVELEDYQAVAAAITDMTVRGAPAIGSAAAFGMALAAQQSTATTIDALIDDLQKAGNTLKAARPTAVNLAWAVDRMLTVARHSEFKQPGALREKLLEEAQRIADEDVAINRQMGTNGAALIKDGATILHHCNTGALATVDYGTALGVIRASFEQG